jgi:hypothetical protein
VTNVSQHGFWVLVGGRELFVPFKKFPWFKSVRIDQLLKVELPHPGHLYWPDLDVDLSVESIEFPEHFPLVSRVRPGKPVQQTRSKRTGRSRSRPRGVRG